MRTNAGLANAYALAEKFVLDRLPWSTRHLFWWVRRKHLRAARLAVEVWVTGRALTVAEPVLEHDLHVGNWHEFEWMPPLFLAFRSMGLVGAAGTEGVAIGAGDGRIARH